MKNSIARSLSLAALAVAASPFARAADGWTPTLDARYRHEHVDEDGYSRDADAHTLRARLGLRTPTRHGWTAFVELEHVEALFGERHDSTANGRTRHPVVADPEATELNQAWIAYAPSAASMLTLGRQRVVFDNQRHFGNVGFRQNEQTFDAFHAQHAIGATTLRYAYLDEVHRVFGDDHPNPIAAGQDLDAHLANAQWKLGAGTLTGYGYFVENEDLPATSARTLGLRYTATHAIGDGGSLVATAEYARQDDHADAPSTVDADYRLGEIGLARAGHALRLGYERLGGNGTYGFQTPFATLHAFNGWADRFLATPVDGLVDRYVSAAGRLGSFDYVIAFHDYVADRGGRAYGTEWNASLRRAFGPRFEAELKAADYASDGHSRDVAKLWLMLTWRH